MPVVTRSQSKNIQPINNVSQPTVTSRQPINHQTTDDTISQVAYKKYASDVSLKNWFICYIKKSLENIKLLANKKEYERSLPNHLKSLTNIKIYQLDNLRQSTELFYIINEYETLLSSSRFNTFVITIYNKIHEFYKETHSRLFINPETQEEILIYKLFVSMLQTTEKTIINLLPLDYPLQYNCCKCV